MKIYFEDGRLKSNWHGVPEECYVDIDAAMGYSLCEILLRKIKDSKRDDVVIYTNAITALRNDFAWNDEIKAPEIYIRIEEDGEFERIDKFTDRELKQGHNIMAMYMNGEFKELNL